MLRSIVDRRNYWSRSQREKWPNDSEKEWPKEWDCSPCMGQRPSSEMGVSQSEGGRNQPCQQENNGAPAHPATATHRQPGLWANHWPCLVPPPVLTLTPYPPCPRSLYLKLSLLSQPALATACITSPLRHLSLALIPATFCINTVTSHLCFCDQVE